MTAEEAKKIWDRKAQSTTGTTAQGSTTQGTTARTTVTQQDRDSWVSKVKDRIKGHDSINTSDTNSTPTPAPAASQSDAKQTKTKVTRDYTSISSAPDYTEYSQKGASSHKDYNYLEKVLLAKPLVNKLVDTSDYNRVVGNESTNKYDINVESMTDSEKGIYNYLFGKEGKDSAEEYFNDLIDSKQTAQNTADQQWWKDFTDKNPVAGGIASFVAPIVTAPFNTLVRGAELSTGEGLSKNSLASIASNQRAGANASILGDANNVEKFLYSTAQSGADLAGSVLLGGPAVLQGLNAANGAIDDAVSRNATDSQAVLEAGIEGTLDYFLGKTGLESLIKNGIVKKAGTTIGRQYAIDMLKSFGKEGLEEGTENVISKIADFYIMGDDSALKQSYNSNVESGMDAKEAFNATLKSFAIETGTEALAGGLIGGVGAGTVAGADYYNSAKEVKAQGNQDYSQYVEGIDTDSGDIVAQTAYEYAAELAKRQEEGKKINTYQKVNMNKLSDELISQPSYNLDSNTDVSQDNGQASFDAVSSPNDRTDVRMPSAEENTTTENESLKSNETKYGENGQKAFNRAYDGSTSVELYNQAFRAFYNAGTTNLPLEKVYEKYPQTKMFERMGMHAYFAGQNDAELAVESAKAAAATAVPAQVTGLINKKTAKTLTEYEKTVVGMVSDSLGVSVEIAETLKGPDGETVANGINMNGRIVVSADSKSGVLPVFTHEVTHELEKRAPAEYKTYSDYVINALIQTDSIGYDKRRKSIENIYKKSGVEVNESVITAEIVANASEEFLTDGDKIKAIIKSDRKVAEKLYEVIKVISDKLNKAFSKYEAKSFEAKTIKKDMDVFNEALTKWQTAFTEAVANKEAKTEAESQKASDTKAETKSDTSTDVKSNKQYSLQTEETTAEDDARSTRSVIADALTGLTTSDEEKEKLAEYKDAIEKIEDNVTKLRMINDTIRELTESGGSREEIDKYQESADKLTGSIQWWDKKLLSLEGLKPIMDILRRDRERTKLTKDEYYKKKLEEGRTRNKERNETFWMKRRIQKKVTNLSRMILFSSDKVHVPDTLKQPILDMCVLFDFTSTPRTEKVSEINERLTALRTALLDYGQGIGDSAIYDPDLQVDIEELKVKIGDKKVSQLSYADMKRVDEIVDRMDTLVRNQNKAFSLQRKADIAELGNEIITQQGAKEQYKKLSVIEQGGILKMFDDMLTSGMLKPHYFFKQMGGTINELYHNVRMAENTYITTLQESIDYAKQAYKDYNFNEWGTDDEKSEFITSHGKQLDLSIGDKLYIWSLWQRPQGKKHLISGGIVQPVLRFGKYIKTQANGIRLEESDFNVIDSMLTDEQKGFARHMVEYLSSTCSDRMNDVSMTLYGYKKFTEKWYVPIKSDSRYTASIPSQKQDARIKNHAHTKSTDSNANNAVECMDFLDMWAKHTKEVSEYSSFVLPMEDFIRVYNYKTPNVVQEEGQATSVAVKSVIANNYGDKANQYIMKLLNDLNGGVQHDSEAEISNWLLSKTKRAAVSANLSVAIQQPSSIARAFALVNPKYFAATAVTIRDYDEVCKYCPQALMKKYNYFDVGLGNSMSEEIKRVKLKGVKENLIALVKDKDRRDDLFGWLPGKMDQLTWSHIWNAIKLETKSEQNFEANSPEYYKFCGERMTEVIDATQVMDSVFQRSQMMRSQNGFVKFTTMFMAEPMTSYNMLLDAAKNRKADKKYARAAVSSVLSSIVINGLLKSIIVAMRDYDDDETFLEKYIAAFIDTQKDSLPSMIPIISSLYSIAEGYSSTRPDMQLFQQLIYAINKLNNDDYTAFQKTRFMTEAVSNLFGIPLKNINRDIEATYKSLYKVLQKVDVIDTPSDYETLKAKYDLTKKNIDGQPNASITGKYNDFMEQAYINGDYNGVMQTAKDLIASGRTELSVTLKVADILRTNEPLIAAAGDAALIGNTKIFDSAINEVISKGFTEAVVRSAIRMYRNDLEEKETSSSTPTPIPEYDYDMMFQAKLKGDTGSYNTMKQYFIKMGKSESSINNAMLDNYNEYAEDNNLTQYTYDNLYSAYQSGNTKEYTKIFTGLTDYGKKEDSIVSEITGRLSSEMNDAIGNYDYVTANDYISKLYNDFGRETGSIKSTITRVYKPLYISALNNQDYDTMRQIEKTLFSLGLGKSTYQDEDLTDWLREMLD